MTAAGPGGMARKSWRRSCRMPTRQVLPGAPRTALLAAAASAQLLVVGARGRDGLDEMTLGSAAQAVLQHASCPVGIVRQAA